MVRINHRQQFRIQQPTASADSEPSMLVKLSTMSVFHHENQPGPKSSVIFDES